MIEARLEQMEEAHAAVEGVWDSVEGNGSGQDSVEHLGMGKVAHQLVVGQGWAMEQSQEEHSGRVVLPLVMLLWTGPVMLWVEPGRLEEHGGESTLEAPDLQGTAEWKGPPSSWTMMKRREGSPPERRTWAPSSEWEALPCNWRT